MKWYTDKFDELKNAKPIISLCGDDCAVCPRYLAKTDDELHQTAVFWKKAGWRDRVVSNEEISCTGCGSKGVCAFGLIDCVKSTRYKAATIAHSIRVTGYARQWNALMRKKRLAGKPAIRRTSLRCFAGRFMKKRKT